MVPAALNGPERTYSRTFPARLGDISSHGGIIVTGAARTLVNGMPVARMLDLHVCPIPFHGITGIVKGCCVERSQERCATTCAESEV
jgi:uncharacterized Zn-binding protein involved in type VI secretion